jgi:hypothetical protein
MTNSSSEKPNAGHADSRGEEISEISLLVPAEQAAELLRQAAVQRITVGQLLRCLIRGYLRQSRP